MESITLTPLSVSAVACHTDTDKGSDEFGNDRSSSPAYQASASAVFPLLSCAVPPAPVGTPLPPANSIPRLPKICRSCTTKTTGARVELVEEERGISRKASVEEKRGI